MDVSVGADVGALTANVTLPEAPPVVVTDTFCAPSAAVAEIWNVAVMFVLLATTTLVTVTPAPPKFTTAPEMKLVPVNVTGTLLPWTPLVGLMDVSVGTSGGVVGDIVRVNALLAVFGGLAASVTCTVRLNVPATVGVPLKSPTGFPPTTPCVVKVMPAGRFVLGEFPGTRDHVYGNIPPVACTLCPYN